MLGYEISIVASKSSALLRPYQMKHISPAIPKTHLMKFCLDLILVTRKQNLTETLISTKYILIYMVKVLGKSEKEQIRNVRRKSLPQINSSQFWLSTGPRPDEFYVPCGVISIPQT